MKQFQIENLVELFELQLLLLHSQDSDCAGFQVDNSEEDLPSVLSSLCRKYASLPHVQELDDTSTSLSNLESVETDLKKKSTSIQPPDPLRLPPTKPDRDDDNGSIN